MNVRDCRQLLKHSKIKVEELKKKAIFRNDNHRTFAVTKVDGCLIKNATAADWVVSVEHVGDIIIELKGSDVEHAAKQIVATTAHWIAAKLKTGKIAGLIVARQYPHFSTGIQRAQQSYLKRFSAPLHVVARNCEFEFEALLEFRPPHCHPSS